MTSRGFIVILMFYVLICAKSSVITEEEEEFLDKMHNIEILEKNPIYYEVLRINGINGQRGVGKNVFKRVIYNFVTYNLKLNQEEEEDYNKALNLYLEYLPDYIEKESFSYYLNEVKFNYLLDHVTKVKKFKDGL